MEAADVKVKALLSEEQASIARQATTWHEFLPSETASRDPLDAKRARRDDVLGQYRQVAINPQHDPVLRKGENGYSPGVFSGARMATYLKTEGEISE
jgi:hypothetical protein